ncbi:MAG TPA: amidohydrolase, partial [Candidatus Methylomirabilis sp.]
MEIAICSTRILTGNPSRPWAEALLVRDNRVVAVGSNDEIRAARSGAAQVFELPGRLVTPGLVDAHLHFV